MMCPNCGLEKLRHKGRKVIPKKGLVMWTRRGWHKCPACLYIHKEASP